MTVCLPSARTVLVNDGERLRIESRRLRDRVLARVLGPILDRRLAAGTEPESSRLLAVRAGQLVQPRARRRLAEAWDELAGRARAPRYPFDPRVPIAPAQVDAAADEIARVA